MEARQHPGREQGSADTLQPGNLRCRLDAHVPDIAGRVPRVVPDRGLVSGFWRTSGPVKGAGLGMGDRAGRGVEVDDT